MPELPEVESTVRYLAERIVGDTVLNVNVLWQRTVAIPTARQFTRRLKGASIVSVLRRGKFIVCRLHHPEEARDQFLICHLRMSGSFDIARAAEEPAPHDRVILELRGGKTVRFNDPRKFGRMYLVDSTNVVLGKLGLEPLSAEFTPQVLAEIVKKRRGAIKPLLLDQRLIAGIGNIYADEALWLSGLHPLRSAQTLGAPEIQRLHAAIQSVLKEALDFNGTDFGDGVVTYGRYQPKVYGRDDETCHRCGKEIRRIVVGQRGTHICVTCQPPTTLGASGAKKRKLFF